MSDEEAKGGREMNIYCPKCGDPITVPDTLEPLMSCGNGHWWHVFLRLERLEEHRREEA